MDTVYAIEKGVDMSANPYLEECKRRCKWCAKNIAMSMAFRTHWTGYMDPPICAAPTEGEYILEQAARIEALERQIDDLMKDVIREADEAVIYDL